MLVVGQGIGESRQRFFLRESLYNCTPLSNGQKTSLDSRVKPRLVFRKEHRRCNAAPIASSPRMRGVLARPADLLEIVRLKETSQPYDHEAFAARVRIAVAEAVGRQIDTGIDVVSDGEQGKPGFANYAKDRLTGLIARDGIPPRISSDQADFPDFQPPEGGILNFRRMVCIGPIGWKDRAAVQTDIDNFKVALQAVQPAEAFLPAVSPGTLAQNVINECYQDEAAFLFAVADVMKEEYQAIVQAGFLLQIDSPDLAMGWHTQFPDKTLEEFRTIIALRVEALNHALAGIPPAQIRHHICWGNGERPHHRDVELKHMIDILLHVRAGASTWKGPIPATGTSGKCSGRCGCQRAWS